MKEAAEFIKDNLLLYQGVTDVKVLPDGKYHLKLQKRKKFGFDTRYVSKKIKENFDGVITTFLGGRK